jgi:hypothetical protein
LQFADCAVGLADFFAEVEALGLQVLLVQSAFGFHLGDVVLDPGQGGTGAQRLHMAVTLSDWRVGYSFREGDRAHALYLTGT